mmetsp:Transcript_7411/g.11281  ORF Transcript_7411/g.11281 Transcript_7411/m.11281 type:complete len:312 (+) Transcript_7411:23-958(+)
MILQSYSFLSIMLLSNAMPSYGHELLQEILPFPDDSPSLVGTNWKMFEINGAVAQGGQEMFFSSESSLSGFNGCHLFDAEWGTVPSSSMITIDIGSISMNECSWMTDVQEQEMTDFVSLLRQDAIAYSISADELWLTMYRDDTPTMTLTRIPNPIQPHERLMGTNWLATDIRGLHTRNTLRPVLEEYPIILSFSRDEVSGNAGCNQFSAETSSSRMTLNKFQVADVAITSMHCGQEAMSQERAFMRILENPGLQYTLSWEQVRGDEWTQVLRLGSPDSAPTMVQFVLLGFENPDEGVGQYPAGSDGTDVSS